jgi:hypothetical protein
MAVDTDRIRTLNDELRQHLLGGGAVMTPGVAALGEDAVRRIVQAIATFDDFCNANDPHEEHDFGSFDFDGANIFFKIDYYDKTMRRLHAFRAIIRATYPSLEAKMASRWTRALEIALLMRVPAKKLTEFFRENGGVAKLARLAARELPRRRYRRPTWD